MLRSPTHVAYIHQVANTEFIFTTPIFDSYFIQQFGRDPFTLRRDVPLEVNIKR